MTIEKAAMLYMRGILTRAEFFKIRSQNEKGSRPMIMWTDGRETICVIEDCFGESPVHLVAELIRMDKQDGTTGGFYYVIRR